MSFAITNNLPAPNIKAIDLKMPPQAIAVITKNNSKNFEDGFFGMKHFLKCS